MTMPKQQSLVPEQTASRGWCARTTMVCVLLAVTTLAVYWPVIFNGFTNYDDGYYVTENAYIQRGLSWDGVVWAFGSLHGEHTYWHPLTWVSHMVDYELFGLRAWGHHGINLLLHTLNTVLVFLVFRRMTRSFWQSAVLAGLFALHPLQVDTVAWVAERKNLLSALFWLLTLQAYTRYAQEPGVGSLKVKVFYGLSLLCFLCGLMCKPVLVTLPFVLLLLDYWPLNRFGLNNQSSRTGSSLSLVLEKVPFLALAAASCLVTVMAHRGLGMLDAATSPSLDLRIENATVSYVRYLGNTVWPLNLAVFYPYPKAWPTWKVAMSGLFLLGVSGLAIHSARNRPYLVVGWFWFLGVLVPFIGLVQAGAQAMADRFAYVPLVGLFLALVWGAHGIANRWRYGAVALPLLAVTASVLCIGLTHRQIGYWKDDESLWRRALAITEGNGLAHLNLGAALLDKRQFDEAIGHLEESLRIEPVAQDAHINLAYALTKQHRLAEAGEHYQAALRLNPNDAGLHNDLGLTLARLGRMDEAIKHYSEALRLKPAFAEVHYNLGLILAKRAKYLESAAHFREVLRLRPEDSNAREKLKLALAAQEKLDQTSEPYRQALKSNPDDARAHGELGRVLLEAGRLDEAIEQCAEAARLDPKSVEAQYQLGAILARKGEVDQAARQFELALELDSNFAMAHYSLGILCQHGNQMPKALGHWREAARLSPQWPDPLNNLAWALATDPRTELRDGPEAVKLASRAAALTGTNNVRVLDTLAAAYAEAGRFTEAAATARQAQSAAAAQGQATLADGIQQRLESYIANQAYREDPANK